MLIRSYPNVTDVRRATTSTDGSARSAASVSALSLPPLQLSATGFETFVESCVAKTKNLRGVCLAPDGGAAFRGVDWRRRHPDSVNVRHRLGCAVVIALAAGQAAAAQDSLPRKLPPVVTVTRDVGRSPLDLPYGITSLRPDSLAPGQYHMNADQTLSLLPGVTVANRTNPSQDTRISVRGFGARSQFGARSIRLLRDGMPLTLPDGQTPIDYLDLESVERVEVIRGAAAALYGNAAGGVHRSALGPTARRAVRRAGALVGRRLGPSAVHGAVRR